MGRHEDQAALVLQMAKVFEVALDSKDAAQRLRGSRHEILGEASRLHDAADQARDCAPRETVDAGVEVASYVTRHVRHDGVEHATLLRVSNEVEGAGVEMGAVNGDVAADGSGGVAHAAELVGFTEAVMGADDAALATTRAALRAVLTDAEFVDIEVLREFSSA